MTKPDRKLYDFTAAAYVVSDGKVLLVAHRKLGKWLPPVDCAHDRTRT